MNHLETADFNSPLTLVRNQGLREFANSRSSLRIYLHHVERLTYHVNLGDA